MNYMEVLMEHYKDPQNYGKLAKPTTIKKDYNPFCGDELTVYLDLEKRVLKDIKFEGKGCAISQAAMSLLSEKLKGMKIEDILKLDKQEVLDLLGIEISAMRLKCALLSLKTIKSAIIEYESGNED